LSIHPDEFKRYKYRNIRPVLLSTEQDFIEAESRKITKTGIFLFSKKKLHKSKIYRIAIVLPERQKIEVKGKLTLSNLSDISHKTNFTESFLSFVEVLEEDRQSFEDAVSILLQ
jgi:predicted CoA-binding protein